MTLPVIFNMWILADASIRRWVTNARRIVGILHVIGLVALVFGETAARVESQAPSAWTSHKRIRRD